MQPMIGRTFRPEEDIAGTNKVVILSHAAWQLHFGGDPAILDRDVLLDNELHRVIGVLPQGVFDRHRAPRVVRFGELLEAAMGLRRSSSRPAPTGWIRSAACGPVCRSRRRRRTCSACAPRSRI